MAQALRFDPSKAAALIAELDQDRVETQVLRARLALLEHDDRTAADLLADLPPATTRRARVERSVLCALSVLERDVERANDHLREALSAGQPERLIRTIVDHGPGRPQAAAVVRAGRRPGALRRRSCSPPPASIVAPVRAEVTPTLVEPLSSREVTVLRYLCSRLTYREIAAALYVSLNTLKSHVRSVYRKLDVASRAEAVDAGRRLGCDLIDRTRLGRHDRDADRERGDPGCGADEHDAADDEQRLPASRRRGAWCSCRRRTGRRRTARRRARSCRRVGCCGGRRRPSPRLRRRAVRRRPAPGAGTRPWRTASAGRRGSVERVGGQPGVERRAGTRVGTVAVEVGELVLVVGVGVDPLEEHGDVDLGLALGEPLGAGRLDAQGVDAAGGLGGLAVPPGGL